MKKLLFLALCFSISFSFAQQEDAWVFFADKENVAESIANPISILTQEAIDRKEMHNTVIDERDVPVNENYITLVKNANGIDVFAKSKWLNCVYVRGTQTNIEALLNINGVSAIEYADKDLNLLPIPEPMDKFGTTTTERVTYNYGAAANQIEILSGDFLHEQDFTGAGMIVAVLDSGFPNVLTNPFFSEVNSDGRLLGTYDFAERQTNVDGTGSHGARTYSDIGAFMDGQFVGTAPEASFYLFRTEFGPTETPVEEAWWVEALERADSLGVDVVNTSLGYRTYDDGAYTHTYEDLDGQTTFAARGANNAMDKGMLLVTSAGNSGSSGFPFVSTPADAPGVLTIGSVDPDGSYTSFSSIGPTVDGRIKPDVMSQGRDAAVITSDGNIDFNNGTSFSSPIIAGVIACLWQARPQTRNTDLMQLIRESAHLFDNPTDQMGYGIPNFEDAYNELIILGVEDEFLVSNFALFPNPINNRVNVSFPQGIDAAKLTLHSILGQKVMASVISKQENQIDTSSLSIGMYIATIEANNQTISFKLIKE